MYKIKNNNKFKVLINTPNLYKDEGGVSNHFYGLSAYMPKNQIHFCFTGGLRNYNKLFAFPIYIFQYIKFIYQLIIFKPDIVHLNPSLCYDAVIRDGIFILISKLFNKKVIVFWHGWKIDFEEKIEKKYLKYFIYIYKKADVFIILSSSVKEKLKQWGFSQPIYSTTTKVDDFLIKELTIESKNPTYNILFLGRIVKSKGIFETLSAFQLSKKNYPNITLTFAGTGPDEKALKTIIKKENIQNVSFTGFIKNNDKISAFLFADIFILPSYTEGMPTSVLEAMAFGIPVITRPVGGIPDFFVNNKMGYLVESKNPIDFAAKIDLLYSNKNIWREISQYNHHYALRHFMASEIAKKMMILYENTVNNKY